MSASSIAIVGGGPAGYFSAIVCAEACPGRAVTIYERSAKPLEKLAASGHGSGNLTRLASPADLAVLFPRGAAELLGPFHRWSPLDTVRWFETHGCRLRVDDQGRVAPASQRAGDLVACLLTAAEAAGVRVHCGRTLVEARANLEGGFRLWFQEGEPDLADRLLLASGDAGRGLAVAASFGHTVIPPVPSLFAMHPEDSSLRPVAEMAIPAASVSLPWAGLSCHGGLTLSARGLTGPAILELSSRAARLIHEHRFPLALQVNWIAGLHRGQPTAALQSHQSNHPHRRLGDTPLFDLPPAFWHRLLEAARLPADRLWSALHPSSRQVLAGLLTAQIITITGRSMNRAEWVSCGGVALPEIDFATMASRRRPGLWLAGGILDCDALPGGANLQAAWTTACLAGRALAS